MLDEFVKFAQTYPSYPQTIQQLHTRLKKFNILQKAYYTATGTYCKGLQKRIRYLHDQLNTLKNEKPACNKPIIREPSLTTFAQYEIEYQALNDIYNAYTPSLYNAIKKRTDAFNNIIKNESDYLHHTNKFYNLNNNIK